MSNYSELVGSYIVLGESGQCLVEPVLNVFPVVITNLLGVKVFGELEFWMSGLKIIALTGLIIMGIVIDLGGNPKHDRIGFRYWQHPYGPMGSYLLSKVHNESLAIFLGFWSSLSTALFSYIGSELVAVTAGEAQNPRETIPRAVRATFLRIFIFYIGGVFAISLIVPSTSNVSRNHETLCHFQPICL